MFFGSLHIGRSRPTSMKAVLLPSAVAFLLLRPPLVARELAPAVKRAVASKYPTLTLAGRICGEVMVRVEIARSGEVRNATVIEGHPMLRESAVYAARQWKFAPGGAETRAARLRFNFVVLPETAQVSSQTIFLPPNGVEIRQKPPSPAVQDGRGDDTGPVTDPVFAT